MNKKTIFIIIAAYLNLTALQYVSGLSGFTGVYIGTGIFSFMPESLIIFGVCIFLLKRFTDASVLHDRRRVIFSGIFGFLLGFACVWGQEILYNTTLFQSASRTVTALLASFGISFFTIPLTSEIIGLCEKISIKPDEEKNRLERFFEQHHLLYFFFIWGIAMACFIPLFLYVWPMNFFGDSYDELWWQLRGSRGTHYPVLHGLMLRVFYNWGARLGNPSLGLQFLTILQMAVLSASIAYFSLYLFDKNVNRSIRVSLLLISILNPVNTYFAVTAEKGTIGIALAFIGLVCLLKMLDYEKADIPVKSKKWMKNAIVFIIVSSAGCLFRNNMIYAYLSGGVVISILRKGWRKMIVTFLVFALLFGSFKLENYILITKENSKTTDRYRETFPLAIMCLSRIAILHKDDMDPDLYNTITAFIPEESLNNYSISTADSIKGDAREEMLKNETWIFIKIFLKGALRYPGDYLDQFAWLTFGYWEPYHAFVLGSTTSVMQKQLPDEYESIEYKNFLPGLSNLYGYLFHEDGRYKVPIFAWCYRSTIYSWSILFLLFFGIYKRSVRKVSAVVIPIAYLGTIFLGPMCMFRYMYFNILTLPLILYMIIEKEKA